MKSLRVLLQIIGKEPKGFRRTHFEGGATLAFKAGAPADLIKAQGDWKSEAYRKYIEVSLNDKLKVAKLMNKKFSR